jgi:uncharacterized protein
LSRTLSLSKGKRSPAQRAACPLAGQRLRAKMDSYSWGGGRLLAWVEGVNRGAMMPLKRLLVLALAGACLTSLAAAATATKRVLYFTKSSGFEHSVIKWGPDGERSHSEKILLQLGPKHGIEFVFSKDGSLFTPEYLAGFDAYVFYTSGDLLSVGTDGHPAMTLRGQQSLFDAVWGGKGFVAVHSGSDTFHTGETGGGNPAHRLQRFRLYGPAAHPYIRMLGGEFIRHGPQQVARARVTAPSFPGFEKLGSHLEVMEEWYSLKEYAPDLHVHLVMETKGMDGSDYQRPAYPLAWARKHGQGRVAYNAMGHREDVWESEAFQSMLMGAIRWAAGLVDAELEQNLEKVTPGHATLPPPPPGMK